MLLFSDNIHGGYFGFQKELYQAVQSNKEYSLHTMYYEKLKKVSSH